MLLKTKFIILFGAFFFGSYTAWGQTGNTDLLIEGGVLWQQVQAGERDCSNLSNQDFSLLGNFFLSLLRDTPYGTLDATLSQQLDRASYTILLSVFGKRLSGCDTSAPLPEGIQFSPDQKDSLNKSTRSALLVMIQIIIIAWITFVIVSILVAMKLVFHCVQSYCIVGGNAQKLEEQKEYVVPKKRVRKTVKKGSNREKKE